MMKPIITAFALALSAFAANAQTAGAARVPHALDATARRAAVDKAAEALRTRYIFPDLGERLADKLHADLAAGEYDELADRVAFAQRLTADMAAIAHDKHLRVMAPGGPPPVEGMGPPPRSDAGVVRADRLAGNIGYIEIIGFAPTELARPAIDKAMAALKDTRALIIDERRNGGGAPETVDYLVSFFTPAGKRVHVNDLIWRNPNSETFRTEEFWSVATPTKYLGRPVYVLTSRFTFSGGEEFAYDMQTLRLATLVGEVTGGGANPGHGASLGNGLMLFVPSGRAENPVTKTSWEGKGVRPDVAAPAPEALRVALQKLGRTPKGDTVEALSEARLFAPRTTPQPGADAAARQVLAELAVGHPRYDRLSQTFGEIVRDQLPNIKARLDKLGPVQTITFDSVGLMGAGVYDVKFARGAAMVAVILQPDGKIAMVDLRPPPGSDPDDGDD